MDVVLETKQLWYASEFDSHTTTMIVKCKKCKTDLTDEMIAQMEGKITKVVCPCELRDKIASEFKLFDTKTQYLKEFDNFLNKLSEKNGVTNY